MTILVDGVLALGALTLASFLGLATTLMVTMAIEHRPRIRPSGHGTRAWAVRNRVDAARFN